MGFGKFLKRLKPPRRVRKAVAKAVEPLAKPVRKAVIQATENTPLRNLGRSLTRFSGVDPKASARRVAAAAVKDVGPLAASMVGGPFGTAIASSVTGSISRRLAPSSRSTPARRSSAARSSSSSTALSIVRQRAAVATKALNNVGRPRTGSDPRRIPTTVPRSSVAPSRFNPAWERFATRPETLGGIINPR